ncbi:MAG: EamA family transporter [Candidatus Woesearchaeota archaeon]
MDWVILVLISAIFLGLKYVTIKKGLFEFKPLPILFFITLLGTLFTLYFVQDIQFILSAQTYTLIILKSLSITISWYFLYLAYKNLDISTVAPLKNLSPVFLVILSFLILGEQITLINYLGIFILILSAYALELKGLNNFLDPFKFMKSKFFIYIIIAIFTTSLSAVLDKVILTQTNYATIMFYFFLFLSIFYFLMLLCKKEIGEIKHLFISKKYFALTILVAMLAFLADTFYFFAVSLPTTAVVLIIPFRNTSNLIATIVGGKLFSEGSVLYKSGVCVVMLVGVLLVVM